MMRGSLFAGTVAALALTSGCGGSSGDGTKPEDAATAFKKQANAICKVALDKLQTVSEDIKDPTSPTKAELTVVVGRLVGQLTAVHTDLEALKPPAGLAPGYQTLLGSLQDVIEVATEKGPKFVKKNSAPFDQVDADAEAIGLDDCAF